MRLTLRSLAALLAYPSEELQAAIGELRDAITEEASLPRPQRRKLEKLLGAVETDDVLDRQAAYSELFDRSRSLSLHLFEHIHGDDRERGQAMIDLGQQYGAIGMFLDAQELPDFIPVFLEYASCLPEVEAVETLSQPAHVFVALAERLDSKGSDYAAIFHALVALAERSVGKDDLAELSTTAHDDAEDPADIDEEWEEAPVTFEASGAHAMGGPTGPVARIRATNRPLPKEE
ncbi:nitrate reductase molybdenum cofactor assembly chaperone [Qipengyuania sp. CAU 1752]